MTESRMRLNSAVLEIVDNQLLEEDPRGPNILTSGCLIRDIWTKKPVT